MTLTLYLNSQQLHQEKIPDFDFTGMKFEGKVRAREVIINTKINQFKRDHPFLFTGKADWRFMLEAESKMNYQ